MHVTSFLSIMLYSCDSVNSWQSTSIIIMAKQITQETFDAAVLENIELLEMNPEDALQEAVQQFEAQVLILFHSVQCL